jgi:hypothetical protein
MAWEDACTLAYALSKSDSSDETNSSSIKIWEAYRRDTYRGSSNTRSRREHEEAESELLLAENQRVADVGCVEV